MPRSHEVDGFSAPTGTQMRSRSSEHSPGRPPGQSPPRTPGRWMTPPQTTNAPLLQKPCGRLHHPGHVVLLPWTPVEDAGMRSPISILTRTTAADASFVRRMNWAEDLVTLVLTAWLIGGLFLDGWAHNTRPQLETFFTPWHAVFYSGFAAIAAWICWSVWSRRGVPAGYGPALVGVAIFLLSGVG